MSPANPIYFLRELVSQRFVLGTRGISRGRKLNLAEVGPEGVTEEHRPWGERFHRMQYRLEAETSDETARPSSPI